MAKSREHRRTIQFSSQGTPRHLPLNNDTMQYLHINFQIINNIGHKGLYYNTLVIKRILIIHGMISM